MKNIVFITAITFPGKEERSKPYKYGLDSWKYWCKKNNCELFVLDEPIFEPEVMVPNFYRYWCFELLDQMGIKYDQILLSDADCIIHPDCPNFFNQTENKYTITHTDGSYDWVCRSMENYSKLIFDGFTFDIFKYFNAGFQVINESHKPIIDKFKEFYLNNRDQLQQIQKTYGVGTDQPLINFFVHKNSVETKYLPYQYCMADLHRKELLNNLLYLKIPGIYQFNAIPNNHGADKTMYYMKETYKKLYEN